MLSSLRDRLDRVGPRVRWLAVAACLLLAAVSALEDAGHATSPPPAAAGRPVVVAARTLATGHVLTARDLRRARWPTSVGPQDTVVTPRRVVGRRLAAPLGPGDAITPRRLLDAPGLTAGLDPGTVAVPVDLGLDVAGLVRPGARVDLIAVPATDALGTDTGLATGARGGGGATVVVRDALVLAVLPVGADVTGSGATRLVLALQRPTALRVAEGRASRTFSIVRDPP